jgi:hypothetical protein
MTAVEWLLYHFDEIYHIKDKFLPSDWEFLEETSKAMEKEQIFDAWNNALINTHIASNSIGVPYDKEKYYNETYNKSNV